MGVCPALRLARRRFRLLGTPNIDDRSIDHVFDVGGVKFLDHLDAGAAVFRDLIHVGPLHQTQTDVGVPQAVKRPTLAFAVYLEVKLGKEGVE